MELLYMTVCKLKNTLINKKCYKTCKPGKYMNLKTKRCNSSKNKGKNKISKTKKNTNRESISPDFPSSNSSKMQICHESISPGVLRSNSSKMKISRESISPAFASSNSSKMQICHESISPYSSSSRKSALNKTVKRKVKTEFINLKSLRKCKPGRFRNLISNRCITLKNRSLFKKIQANNEDIKIPSKSKEISSKKEVDTFYKFIEALENIGRTEYQEKGIAYVNNNVFFYPILIINLLKKYNSKCFILNKYAFVHNFYFYKDMQLKNQYRSYLKNDINYFSRQILKCIKANQNDENFVAIIPVGFGTQDWSHANMLIYRHKTSTLEHFEPHGNYYEDEQYYSVSLLFYKTLKEIVNTMNNYNNKKNMQFYKNNITYIEPINVCPYMKGLQTIEGEVIPHLHEDIVTKEGKGFCIMWSVFFAEIVILNPSYDSKQLLYAIITWINKKPANSMFVRNIIRGYIHIVYNELNDILKNKLHIDIIELQSNAYELNGSKFNKLQMYIADEFKKINSKSLNKEFTHSPSISISIPEILSSI
jgi:hypothetical protein